MKPWVSSFARRLTRTPDNGAVEHHETTAIPSIDELRSVADSEVELEILQWSVWHNLLRVRFELTPGELGYPTHAIFYFSCEVVEVPLAPQHAHTLDVEIPREHVAATIPLGLRMGDREVLAEGNPGASALQRDPSGAVFQRFLDGLRAMPSARVLEIGSRARSGTTYRHFLPPHADYVGVDVKGGPNVDVVADAHDLSAALGDQRFDAVFSISVFEHLAMPWKAALSINRVLHTGGLVFIGTHQSFPVHDQPWDFWRFSDEAWKCLFNGATGFEVVEAALGEPAEMVALASHPAVWRIEEQRAYFTSNALMRKIGETTIDWPVAMSDLDVGDYPA